MKAYISVDLEGLPGVVSLTMINPWNSQFQVASKVMTRLVNAMAEELYGNGFDEVYVADSHGLMTNIDYLSIDSRVHLIQGYPRPFAMVTMLDNTFDAIFYLGYHTGAGTIHGSFDHTYNGRVFAEIKVNGIRMSEYLLNTLFAGERGVPAVFLAGDELLSDEVEKYTPWVVFVPLKKGISRLAAIYPGLERVITDTRKGVREACLRLKERTTRLLKIEKPYRVEVILKEPIIADVLEKWSIIERDRSYVVKFTASNADELLSIIEIISFVGVGVEYLKSNAK